MRVKIDGKMEVRELKGRRVTCSNHGRAAIESVPL